MSYSRIVLSAAICLFAAALFAAEPECATNYHSDGKSAETFVLTGLTPQAVIERLPRLLTAEGVTMYTSQPEKGILNAGGLDVKAETSGDATRVTFHSSVGANQTLLCRYAGLVGNPPKPRKTPPAQDPALISQMKRALLTQHLLSQPDSFANDVTFKSQDDFLEFAITDMTQLADGTRKYEVSILVPRSICHIGIEDTADGAQGFVGRRSAPRTKPVRIEASMTFAREGETWQMANVTIEKIESTK